MDIAGCDGDALIVVGADDQPSCVVDGFKNAAHDLAVLIDGDRRADTGGGLAPVAQNIGDATAIGPEAATSRDASAPGTKSIRT